MDRFKFNFISWGQLEGLSLVKFFLTVFIYYHAMGFFGNLIFPFLFECSAKIILMFLHLCPGSNAVTNFTNFTIFRFSCICNKICDFLLNSTTNFTIFRNCVQSWTSLCFWAILCSVVIVEVAMPYYYLLYIFQSCK